jgi:exosortase A-associated hydrolase 1
VNYTEQAMVFPCGGESLVGVLAAPQMPFDTAVLVIVGGPQYRVGSHRQFVLLARRLAESGYPVLRFDCSGMGDSTGAPRSFELLSPDIGAAIDALQEHIPQVRQVVLWGLCDGASAALLYCHDTHDVRVGGLCLLNPWVRSDISLARTHVKHYYAQRVIERAFWLKLLRGEVGAGALRSLVRNVKLTFAGSRLPASPRLSFQQRMAIAWNEFQCSILLLLSGDDYTAKEFLEHTGSEPAWADARNHARLQRHDLAGADHTFSCISDRMRAEDLTLAWIGTLRTR